MTSSESGATNTPQPVAKGTASADADQRLAEAYFAYALSGIVVTDEGLRMLRVNPAASSIMGIPRHRLLGRTLGEVLDSSGENPARAARHFALLREQGIARAELGLPPLDAHSDSRVIEIASIDIGEKRLLHVFDDVTAQRQLLLATEQARIAADNASQAKSTFLANMSHEIRTPLNGVIGLAEVLRLTALDPVQKDYAGKILQSSKALLAILNDLLDLSKVEAGRMEFENRPFDLAAMLDELAATAQPMAQEKGIGISFCMEPGTPQHIVGDRLRLAQVLRNLIGNALKFTARGTVAVSVEAVTPPQSGTWLRWRVADTGIGMSAQDQARLFLPFTQADASTARRFGGTGLGLAISRTLTEGMGGRIELASQPGQGSTFTVWLPCKPAPPAAAATTAEEIPLEKNEFLGSRVLIAEDNAINREVITQLLRHAGIEVTQACNGLEVLQQLAGNRGATDLILMDVQMPEKDGLSAATSLRSDGFTLPIVALSAGASASERAACEAAGMNDFLAKPIDIQDLAAVLTRWLPAAHAAPPPSQAVHSATGTTLADADFPGLDLSDALPRFLGRRDLLTWARDTVLREYGETPARLLQLLADRRCDEMARILHGLRGAAGNIGARELTQQARDLESLLADTSPKPLEPLINALRSELERLSPHSPLRSAE